jgi:hypothetical protein
MNEETSSPTFSPKVTALTVPTSAQEEETDEVDESALASQLSQEYQAASKLPQRGQFLDREFLFVLYTIILLIGVLLPFHPAKVLLSLPERRLLLLMLGVPLVVIVVCAFLFGMATASANRGAQAIAQLLEELSKLD